MGKHSQAWLLLVSCKKLKNKTYNIGIIKINKMDVEIEGQKFVSSRTINRERQELREARVNVLKNAEKKYMARVEKEEQAIARGDNKWMLPELEKELESKKRKKKHKK